MKVNSVSDTFVAVLFNEAQKHRLRDAVGHGVLCSKNTLLFLCKFIKQLIVFHIHRSFCVDIVHEISTEVKYYFFSDIQDSNCEI